MSNVIKFGTKFGTKASPPPPPRPPDGDLGAYAASRRIAQFFDISVSTQDAVKLELHLQRMMAHSYHQGHADGTTWRGLMAGVRVDGTNVIVSAHGGNEGARALCGELVKVIEQ